MSLTNKNNSDFINITENNYNRIHNTVSKVGYSDGITDGRESVFQDGFDSGYKNGLATGFELAKYKAFFEVMNNSSSTPSAISLESNCYKQLHIANAADKSHFMGNGDEVSHLSQQQLDYVNENSTLFTKDLPIATSLFSR